MKVSNKDGYEKMQEKMYGQEQQDKQKEVTDSFVEKLTGIHNNECNFFEYFQNVPGYPIPKAYYLEKFDPKKDQNGVIFMEDLSGAAKALRFVQTLKIEQVKKLVEHLASFHAYQLTYENPKWKGVFSKVQTDPTTHQEMCKAIRNVKTYNNGLYAKQIEELENIFFNHESAKYFIDGICDELGIPKVVCHGDFHSNNILLKIDSDSNILNEVVSFVDFQAGSPALDLARLMASSVDAEIRRDLETFIFEFYMEKLTEAMALKGKTPEFDVENFKTAYEFAFIYQCHAAFMLPPYFSALCQSEKNTNRKSIVEAEIAKLELRGRLALEDTQKIVKKHESHWTLKI
uniref:CHK kinase-like domain-containing protein n=1 Tax=Acrobeloides nanus TaxID=290746 RepID=A0A914DSN4_9BILA